MNGKLLLEAGVSRSMKLTRWKPLIVAGAVVLTTPLVMGSAILRPSFDQRILAAQNAERLELGLQPMRWNDTLAESAQRWADYLASSGRFEHAPEDVANPEGENLWAGTKGYYSPEEMVEAWAREKQFFRPGLFPENSTTGDVEDVGHYTQIVWRATTQVGCAQATSMVEDILVCRYAEAGNYIGERPF
jgi:Cysteine-rich secretory protein family